MGWSPSNTTLASLDEGEQFTKTITYVDDITQQSYDVSLSVNEDDAGVTILSNRIYGSYIEAFDQFIRYRTKQDTFIEVNNWSEIGDDVYGVYHFQQDTRNSKTYTVTADAGVATKTYSIIVANDIDYDKRMLAKFINPAGILVSWTNLVGDTVSWINSNNQEVEWTT